MNLSNVFILAFLHVAHIAKKKPRGKSPFSSRQSLSLDLHKKKNL